MKRNQSVEVDLRWTSTMIHIGGREYAEFWIGSATAQANGRTVPVKVHLAVYIDEDGTEFSVFKAPILKRSSDPVYKVSLPIPQVPYTVKAYANNIEVKEHDFLLFWHSTDASGSVSACGS